MRGTSEEVAGFLRGTGVTTWSGSFVLGVRQHDAQRLEVLMPSRDGDGDDHQWQTVTVAAIRRAWQERVREIRARLTDAEDMDADDADCILQCALYGEEVFA